MLIREMAVCHFQLRVLTELLKGKREMLKGGRGQFMVLLIAGKAEGEIDYGSLVGMGVGKK